MADFEALQQAIIKGKNKDSLALTEALLAEGVTAKQILDEGMIPGMNVVGEKFKNNEYYVPEVLIAARAMKAAMDLVRPKLIEAKVEPKGRVAIATVRGDLHDIGKNLVAMMLEGAGYDIIDLGVDCSPEQFVDAVVSQGAGLIAMSALLTTTMPSMKETVDALKEAGARDKAKVMIGGAPVTQQYADEIGADGYSADAASAVDLANSLIG